MIRPIGSAAILGTLLAAGSLYAANEQAWRNTVAGWLGRAPETKVAAEDWPICTTMTAMGTESDWAQLDPDFAAGKKALLAEDWNGALAALKLAALRDPRSADIQNYIGYAYRRLRQFGPAMGHYQQALMFNPRQRSAREHLGELFLVLGEPVKAQEQLAALKDICLIPCDELTDLERAIAAYRAAPDAGSRVGFPCKKQAENRNVVRGDAIQAWPEWQPRRPSKGRPQQGNSRDRGADRRRGRRHRQQSNRTGQGR